MLSRLLNKRRDGGVEFDTLDIGLSCKEADILSHRLLFDGGAQPLGQAAPVGAEGLRDCQTITGAQRLDLDGTGPACGPNLLPMWPESPSRRSCRLDSAERQTHTQHNAIG